MLDLKLQLLDSKLELLDTKIKLWEAKPKELDIKPRELDTKITSMDFDLQELTERVNEMDSLLRETREEQELRHYEAPEPVRHTEPEPEDWQNRLLRCLTGGRYSDRDPEIGSIKN